MMLSSWLILLFCSYSISIFPCGRCDGAWECLCVSVHAHNSETADQIALKCLQLRENISGLDLELLLVSTVVRWNRFHNFTFDLYVTHVKLHEQRDLAQLVNGHSLE